MVVTCCERGLTALQAKEMDEGHQIQLQKMNHEYYLQSTHVMKKNHSISFIALVSSDKLVLSKQYPQWDLQAYIPYLPHGVFYVYCSQHGLFYQMF